MKFQIYAFQHLGFVHCPIREHCPAFPHCTDAIVERTVSRKYFLENICNLWCQVSKRVSRPASWLVDGRSGDSNHLNIILLGADVLAGELSSQVTSD